MRFKTNNEFLDYLLPRMSKGRYGIDHFKRAMDFLNNPQFDLKVIHVGGTNGKGSTTNFLRSIYQNNGYKVGTFTSPHLEVHNDRIRINDIYISDEDMLYYGNKYFDVFEEFNLSMFEIDVLITVMYFIDKKVDLAIFEVGLGGRLDATNIVDPLASVITTIGFDHMEYLGNTLEEISAEKAGIIKQNRKVFVGEPKEECINVFKEKAAELHCEFYPIELATDVHIEGGCCFEYEGQTIHLISLAKYQANNAHLALEVAKGLKDELPYDLAKAIEGVHQTQWKGRFEEYLKPQRIILDGAHNEHGMQALVDSIDVLKHPLVAVFSALKDKDTDGMIEDLLKVCDQVIVTQFEFYRAQSLENLAKDYQVLAIEDPKKAIEKAYELSDNGSLLITGSLYFISLVRQEILESLKEEGVFK